MNAVAPMAGKGSPASITDALRTLELSEARWQAVLASARDPIIGIDPRGAVTFFNQAAEENFGYAASEVIDTDSRPKPHRQRFPTIWKSCRAPAA